MTGPPESDRTPLCPSGWNYWRPFYMGKAWRTGCLAAPLILLAVVVESEWLIVATLVLSGVAQLLVMRGQRDAFFTPARIHHRHGLLGLTTEDVPMRHVDQVLVDPVRLLPGMGSLTVQCGTKYLQFECVSDAEAKAQQIRELAEAARRRQTEVRE